MRTRNGPQILTIDEIIHHKDGVAIWSERNVGNIWHHEGQEFLLAVAFDTDHGISIPSQYYLGLDARNSLDVDDTLSTLLNEPSTNGYVRQSLSSSSGFAVGLTNGQIRASSAVITFTAVGGAFGPVKNLFLTTSSDDSGYLIATSALSGSRTVNSGESLTARVSLSLAGCA